MNTKRKYWYATDVWGCPICGSEETYRYRVYDEAERGYHFYTSYDYCQE